MVRRRASGRDAVPERRSAKTRLVNLQPQKMPAVFQPGSQERRHICQMFHGRRRAASARNAKLTPPRWRRGEPLGVGHERSLPTGAMLARPHSLSVRPPTLERWWCAGCCGKLGVGKTQPELCSHPENYGHRSPEPAKAVRPIATRSKRLPARLVLPRTLCGMLVKPLLVSEEVAQRSSDLPAFVALGAAREQARVLEHLAAQLNKLRDCIEGVMLRESKLS